MCDQDRRYALRFSIFALGAVGVLGIAGSGLAADPVPKPKVYVCPPCGCGQDDKELPEPGVCSVCGMPLVEKGTTVPAPSASLAHTAPEAGQEAHPGWTRPGGDLRHRT